MSEEFQEPWVEDRDLAGEVVVGAGWAGGERRAVVPAVHGDLVALGGVVAAEARGRVSGWWRECG